MQTIVFTEPENRFMQQNFLEMYQDDRIRSLEGPIILGILKKFEAWPTAPLFTEQENRRIQVFLETSDEVLEPYPYPYTPQTFGQDTHQIVLIKSILGKLKIAAAS